MATPPFGSGSTQQLAVGGQQQQQQTLPTLVRNWVHYDNLNTKYSKEATAARKMREEFEAKIMGSLRLNNMTNAVIKIADGQLQCVEEKQVPSLTMPRLEAYLHAYYKTKGNYADETDAIMRFIKQQKVNSAVLCTRLRKTEALPNLPTPGSGSA